MFAEDDMGQERRRRTRVNLELPLTIIFAGEAVSGQVRDLSLKGLSCSTADWLLPGWECDVEMELNADVRIRIHGRIVRSGEDGAIDFLNMDETSFGHLRNLIRLYADDADAVDDEMLTPAFAPATPSPK